MAFYFRLFWLPTLVSAVVLILLWVEGELSDAIGGLLAGWFLLALATQYVATTTGAWIAGLTLQTALAVFLVLKQQIAR